MVAGRGLWAEMTLRGRPVKVLIRRKEARDGVVTHTLVMEDLDISFRVDTVEDGILQAIRVLQKLTQMEVDDDKP